MTCVLVMAAPARPHGAAQARRAVEEVLRDYGVGDEDRHRMALAVGEVCANAATHAESGARFRVRVHVRPERVAVGVRDYAAATTPHQVRSQHAAPVPPLAEAGRGLAIVNATVDRVEVRDAEPGTLVLLERRYAASAESEA